jgi:hypothetical protein
MKKNQLVTDVIEKIDSVLEKSRDSLSNEDVKIFEDAIVSLRKVEHSTPQEMKSSIPVMLELLLRVLLCPETLEQIHHLLKNL